MTSFLSCDVIKWCIYSTICVAFFGKNWWLFLYIVFKWVFHKKFLMLVTLFRKCAKTCILRTRIDLRKDWPYLIKKSKNRRYALVINVWYGLQLSIYILSILLGIFTQSLFYVKYTFKMVCNLCIFVVFHDALHNLMKAAYQNSPLKNENKDVLRVDVQRIVFYQRYRYPAFEPCVHPPTWKYLLIQPFKTKETTFFSLLHTALFQILLLNLLYQHRVAVNSVYHNKYYL